MLSESIFSSANLCVVGNVNRDLKTTPFKAGAYLFEDGETSLAGVQETIGGGGANSAAIAAHLGAPATFIGQAGQDRLGDRLEEALTRCGVRCCLHRNADVATGTTINLVYDTGRRHFLSCHPNNEALCFDALDLRGLRGAGHLLRADLWFSESMLHGGNEKLFRLAREQGMAVSIDLNWDPKWGRATPAEDQARKEAVRKLLPLVDLAHGNIRELNAFADAEDLRAGLARIESWGAGAVVVHMGERGAGFYTKGELTVEKPAPIERQQMVTGTGDVLSVCLILMHHRAEIPIAEKLKLANTVVAGFIEGRRRLIPTLAN